MISLLVLVLVWGSTTDQSGEDERQMTIVDAVVRAAKSGASNIVEIDGDAQSVRNTDEDDNYSEHFRYTNRAK